MSKKTLYWLLALMTVLLLIKNSIGDSSEAPKQWSHLKSRTAGWLHSVANNSHQPRAKIHAHQQLAQKYPIFNTMALPWGDSPSNSTAVANTSLVGLMGAHHYQPDSIGGGSSQYRAQLATFSIGIEINESGSAFICPSDLPYAVSYQLTNPVATNMQGGALESPTIITRGYKNDCVLQNKYDLLYGNDQHPDRNGSNTKNLTAFVPSNLPEGCNSGLGAKQPVIFKASALTIESPVYQEVNNQMQAVGYTQQTIVAPIDCNMVCNTMLDYYCNADATMNYCGEEVLDSYYISSVYKAHNQRQYFCSCKIYNVAWGNVNWAFTNAVDVESAVKYNNPLKNVTCSNVPPR